MQILATIVIRALEIIFLAGLAGSAVVVTISFIEDFRILLERDNK